MCIEVCWAHYEEGGDLGSDLITYLSIKQMFYTLSVLKLQSFFTEMINEMWVNFENEITTKHS